MSLYTFNLFIFEFVKLFNYLFIYIILLLLKCICVRYIFYNIKHLTLCILADIPFNVYRHEKKKD